MFCPIKAISKATNTVLLRDNLCLNGMSMKVKFIIDDKFHLHKENYPALVKLVVCNDAENGIISLVTLSVADMLPNIFEGKTIISVKSIVYVYSF